MRSFISFMCAAAQLRRNIGRKAPEYNPVWSGNRSLHTAGLLLPFSKYHAQMNIRPDYGTNSRNKCTRWSSLADLVGKDWAQGWNCGPASAVKPGEQLWSPPCSQSSRFKISRALILKKKKSAKIMFRKTGWIFKSFLIFLISSSHPPPPFFSVEL